MLFEKSSQLLLLLVCKITNLSLLYRYTKDIFAKGFRKVLSLNDLYDPAKTDCASFLGDQLEKLVFLTTSMNTLDNNFYRSLILCMQAMEYPIKTGNQRATQIIKNHFFNLLERISIDSLEFCSYRHILSVSFYLIQHRYLRSRSCFKFFM